MSGIAKNQESRSGWVYSVSDPLDNLPRYVGQTRSQKGIEARLKRHIRDASKTPKTIFHKWIQKVLRKGRVPCVNIIEFVANGLLIDEREIFWISEGRKRGWKLTNQAKGGWSGFTRLGMKNSPEHIRKTAEANRGKKRTDAQKKEISLRRRKDTRMMNFFAQFAHIGGAAAAKKLSVPHWCEICQKNVPTTVEWRSHQKERHPEILKVKLDAARKKGRENRWKKYYESKRTT